MARYQLLPQFNTHQVSDFPISQISIPSEFLSEAVFAGGNFWGLEAAFGRVEGVIRTATGYCGGTLRKPSYREVCEGKTGHTEAVKVIYDKRKVSFRSLCDFFWEFHDCTNKDYLNFGLTTHQRSAIFYNREEERKHAQESRIRWQMKLNKRIVTKAIPFKSEFYMAENQHQKYYLQKNYRLCESLNLRSTEQFVESNIACKLNGILAMEARSTIDKLTTFLQTKEMMTLQEETRLVCKEIIEVLRRDHEDGKSQKF
ncbi:peptide methionine sulfoxide reductase-like [Durio zibethinus]|uniref:peptide-methionine (S)-S-oxide reductase n=1 Tax=Durio zibethinus TaxID=66656 RepID=A0A6P6A2R9_DURZI|nr:peptide methionine sulfoxide reductase-like [Durio zibethinus]